MNPWVVVTSVAYLGFLVFALLQDRKKGRARETEMEQWLKAEKQKPRYLVQVRALDGFTFSTNAFDPKTYYYGDYSFAQDSKTRAQDFATATIRAGFYHCPETNRFLPMSAVSEVRVVEQ